MPKFYAIFAGKKYQNSGIVMIFDRKMLEFLHYNFPENIFLLFLEGGMLARPLSSSPVCPVRNYSARACATAVKFFWRRHCASVSDRRMGINDGSP